MNISDKTSIKDFYTTKFTSPMLRSSDIIRLESYIDIAEIVIARSIKLLIGQSNKSFKKYFKELTHLIDVDYTPIVSIDYSSIKIDGIGLGYTADDYYKFYEAAKTYVIFYDGVTGLLEFDYAAGISINDSICLAFSLLINHMIEIKMIESESVGVISVKQDRLIIPQEVSNLLNASSISIGGK